MVDYETWEALARLVHEQTGLDGAAGPVSAFDLAALCGLAVVAGAGLGGLDLAAGIVTYPASARPTRQHAVIAHEVGHWLLDYADEPDSEAGADYLADALMLPRSRFDADLRASSWDFRALRKLHANCPASMIARRIVSVRDAVATVVDEGRGVTMRVASPWISDPRFRRLSAWERTLAVEALAEGLTVHGDDLCYAVPIIDGPHRRVVIVCEAERLAQRISGTRSSR